MRRFIHILALLVLIVLYSVTTLPATHANGPEQTPTPSGGTEVEPAASTKSYEGLNLSASVRGGGSYRVGSWLPVVVTVENNGPDLVAEVRISGTRGGAQYAATLDLPRNSRKTATVYVFTNRFTRRLTMNLFRGDEQLVQQQIVVDPHQITERLVAVATDSQMPFRLPPTVADGSKLVAVPLALADFPDQFAGFSSFDALILDEIALNELPSPQLQALDEWLARGGQVIINGGEGATRTLAGLPEEMRPVSVAGTTTVAIADILPSTAAEAGTVQLAEITPLAGTLPLGNLALGQTVQQPLLFERPLGKGSIIFSTLRLNEPLLLAWEQSPTFWTDLLPERPALPPGFGPSDVTPDQMIEGNIAASLTRLPALELPSLTLLGLLLLVYVVLVGPITYLVLRKLDRQALGWVIVPILTVIFAALAYGVGYARRGGDVVVNQIALIEPLGDGNARVRSFVGLFSPASQAYSIELGQQSLLRPISLQGPWDTTEQDGVFGSDRATEVDVPQWSMRAVLADSVQPFSGLQATVTLDGMLLHGEVVNNTDQLLRDVVLVQDVHIGEVGDLQPGERKTVTFGSANERELANRRTKFSGTPLSYMIYNELFEQQQGPNGGQPLPPIIQLRQGLLDAIYAIGPVQRNPTPLLIAWADTPPVNANVPSQKVARQQLALITMEPALELASPEITLDQGWFQHAVEIDDPMQAQMVCMGSKGLGVNVFGQTAIQTLTLPKSLRGLQVEQLKLMPSGDAPLPADMQLELYDWQEGVWVPQPIDGQKVLDISDPTRFLSAHTGQIRAQLSGQMNPQGGGCVYIDATVTGRIGA